MKMKIGFIGFGKSAHRYHLPFIIDSGLYEVSGYYSRGLSQFEMPYPQDVHRLDSIAAVCEMSDIVVITTPAKLHYEHAKECLNNNVHVLVEKPFCSTTNEAKELFKLAKTKRLTIMPYQNRRFDSDFLTLKKTINDNLYGEIMEIESNHTHYRTDGLNQTGDQYDGSIYGHAVHFIDQIVSMYGEPDDVIADITNQKDFYLNHDTTNHLDDYYDIKLIYGNLRIRVRYSQLIVKSPPRFIVNGTLATGIQGVIDQQEYYLKQGIYPGGENFGQVSNDDGYTLYRLDGQVLPIDQVYLGYTKFYIDLYQTIVKNEPPLISESECLITLNILESIVNKRAFKKMDN